MAKLTGAQLILRLGTRMGWLDAAGALTAAQRAQCLVHLQEAENFFSQGGSAKHLERETTLVLGNTLDFIDVPSWVNIGMTMSMGLPNGNGEVKILPADRFRRDTKFTYGAWGLTSPETCHIARDTTGATLRFIFDRANTTGGNLTFPFSAQQLPTVLADDASTSALPETYETSLLLKYAEFEAKREIRAIVTDQERKALQDQIDAFFSNYRSSREVPMPDNEAAKRKVSEQLAEGR